MSASLLVSAPYARSIPQLNHDAVRLMREGNFEEAGTILEMGCERLTRLQATAGCTAFHEDEREDQVKLKTFPCATPSTSEHEDSCSVEMFDRAFTLVISSSSGGEGAVVVASGPQESEFHHILWSCVFQYNLALCCHLLAIRKGNAAHFIRAMRLYEETSAAVSILTVDFDEEHYFTLEQRFRWELALLNNCAHICLSRNLYEATQGFTRRMHESLEFASMEGALDPGTFAFFWRNASLPFNTSASAA